MAAYSEDLGELQISDFETSSYSLNPTCDQHLISPNSITPESHIKVMRIKETISNSRSSWLLEQRFSLIINKGNV